MSDLIKKKDVLALVKSYIEASAERMENDGYYEAQFEGFEELQDDLFNLETSPSADRPQGEWIEHKERTIVMDGNFIDFFPTEYECSNCGLRRATYFINSPLPNYCPNCGARMKGADYE